MAAVALGSSVYLPVTLFACGVLMIIGPVIANMRGKSHESRVGYMTNHGLWLALMLSLVSMPVIYALRNVFGWISDDAAMCEMASAYMFAIMWGLPANLGFVALKSLNEGSNMTRPAMYVGICGLLLNIPLNYMFVFGMYGFPRMGGAGCGAATAVIFYIEFLLMFLLVYFNPKHRPYRRHIVSWRRPTPSVITHLVRLGVPIGISQLCEVMLFCAAALVLAPLGKTQVASHQIAGNVGGLVFMLPLSVGLAASIRVAYHHGKKNVAGTRSAILSAYVLVLSICLCTIGGIILFREQIVHLYNDSELIGQHGLRPADPGGRLPAPGLPPGAFRRGAEGIPGYRFHFHHHLRVVLDGGIPRVLHSCPDRLDCPGHGRAGRLDRVHRRPYRGGRTAAVARGAHHAARICPDAAGRGVILPPARASRDVYFSCSAEDCFCPSRFRISTASCGRAASLSITFFFPPYSRIMSPAPFLAGMQPHVSEFVEGTGINAASFEKQGCFSGNGN